MYCNMTHPYCEEQKLVTRFQFDSQIKSRHTADGGLNLKKCVVAITSLLHDKKLCQFMSCHCIMSHQNLMSGHRLHMSHHCIMSCHCPRSIILSSVGRNIIFFFRIEQLKALLEESTTSESDSDESSENSSNEEKRKRQRKSKAKHKKEKKKHKHKHRKSSKHTDSDSDSRKKYSKERKSER